MTLVAAPYAIIPPHYHLPTPHPRAPIATINAIGIITDSDDLLALLVAGITVHRPRLLSADDVEN